jgi:putative membrane protein
MPYLSIKALHVMFAVAWSAGQFDLPRSLVYHAAAATLSDPRFKVMQQHLYAPVTLAGVAAALFGTTSARTGAGSAATGSAAATLGLVLGLVVYHIWRGRLVSQFRNDGNRRPGPGNRSRTEAPTPLLFMCVEPVVVKPP